MSHSQSKSLVLSLSPGDSGATPGAWRVLPLTVTVGAGTAEILDANNIPFHTKVDLQNADAIRLVVGVAIAGVNSAIEVEYSTSEGSFIDIGGVTTDTTGVRDSGWIALPAGAKAANIYLSLFLLDTSGDTDLTSPSISFLGVYVRAGATIHQMSDWNLILNWGYPPGLTWNAPGSATTELFGLTSNRTIVDLTQVQEIRLVAIGVVTGDAVQLGVQYSVDSGANWNYIDVAATGPLLSITSGVISDTGWVAIAAGAKADSVWLRLVGKRTASGAHTAKWGPIGLYCR